ncbi:hypothetical protein D3C73_681140 [compost metagenome]
MENLMADVAFEDVGEIFGRRTVHRPEVLGIHQVIDQLPRVGFDVHGVDVPVVYPVRIVHLGQVRNDHALFWRTAFGVVPDKQQVIFLAGQPAAGLGLGWDALAVGDLHALAAGVVLPVVERAHQPVVLDGALGQVGAHVRAIGVQNADGALAVGKGHQADAKHFQGMGLAITVIAGIAQAVPAACVTVGTLGVLDVDFSEFGHCYCSSNADFGAGHAPKKYRVIPWRTSLSSRARRTSFSWTRSNATGSQSAPMTQRAPCLPVTGRSAGRLPGRSPGD